MKLVFGTMNFGPQVDLPDAKHMIASFFNAGYREIDTAYVYNEGTTEKMLGRILPDYDRSVFSIATKVNPRITGRLDKNAVQSQCHESLERMNLQFADILYLHVPDANTPVEDALEACALLYQNNKIKEIGLSNFPSWLVAHSWHVCKKNNWPLPTVYQGLYNAIGRNAETELFRCLRHYNIRFYAFNPLAGGMLTGKHLSYEEEPNQGRFSRLASYRKRYWKKSFFNAVNVVSTVSLDAGIKPAEAAYRWLIHHSMLESISDDAIIIGASTMDQFFQNLEASEKVALPGEVLKAFDEAWLEAKSDSPGYFYFYNQ